MPQLIVTETPAQGIEHCRQFLQDKNRLAAKKAATTIQYHFKQVEANPYIGKPLHDYPYLRELLIPFGDSGYTALYQVDDLADIVYILAFRHQKEAGF